MEQRYEPRDDSNTVPGRTCVAMNIFRSKNGYHICLKGGAPTQGVKLTASWAETLSDAIEMRTQLRIQQTRQHSMRRAFNTIRQRNEFPEEVWVSMQTPRRGMIEVSDHGRVRNIHHGGLYRLSIKDRYLHVDTQKVHRLVAAAFIPNPMMHPTVNHKDHDPRNNRKDNLEWASYAYQNQHRRKPPRCQQRLVSSRAVIGTSIEDGQTVSFDTMEDAVQFLLRNGLSNSSKTMGPKSKISAVAIGKPDKNGRIRRKAFGYTWAYVAPTIVDDEHWVELDPQFVRGTAGYLISDKGRIRNRTGRVSSGTCRPNEYTCVSVGGWQYLLHILVARSFLPPPSEGQTQVNHKDRNKRNARSDNLEWASPSENIRHRYATDSHS